jgi:glucose/arabinose dehydrogenase
MRLDPSNARRRGLLLAALSLACADRAPAPLASAEVRVVPGVPERPPPNIVLDTVAHGLEVPWAMSWAPDGRLFVTERVGRIAVIHPDGRRETWAEVEAFAEATGIGPESGLMGIAVSPDFARDRAVYVVVTRWRTPGDSAGTRLTRLRRKLGERTSGARGLRLRNQIVRLTDREGRGTDPQVIVSELPAHHYHAGGGLAFGPESLLYVSVGDALTPALARDERYTVGKVLRFKRDGGIPATNPDTTSPVFARGLRNTQAFAWLADGTLLGVDHGPSGMAQERGRAGQDELNMLVAGADYGWPEVTGTFSAPGITDPVHVWTSTVAPAGIARWPASTADGTAHVTVGALAGRLELLTLTKQTDRWQVVARSVLLSSVYGRLRGVAVGPDGALYVTTSNRDARGQPSARDDLLLRVRLADTNFLSTAARARQDSAASLAG